MNVPWQVLPQGARNPDRSLSCGDVELVECFRIIDCVALNQEVVSVSIQAGGTVAASVAAEEL
jgi:hypothetical protein